MSDCCIKDAEVVPVFRIRLQSLWVGGHLFRPDSAAILANKTKVGFVSVFVSGDRVGVVENSCKHSFGVLCSPGFET